MADEKKPRIINENSLTFTGRLVKDAESGSTKNGNEYVSFTLAHNHSKDSASFLPFTAWNGIGALLKDKKKGDKITVTAYLKQETWKGSDDKTQSAIKGNVTGVISHG